MKTRQVKVDRLPQVLVNEMVHINHKEMHTTLRNKLTLLCISGLQTSALHGYYTHYWGKNKNPAQVHIVIEFSKTFFLSYN